MDPNQPSEPANDPLQNINNPLKVMQQGERVLCEIRRHPVGIWGVYGIVAIIIIAAIAAVVIAPNYISGITQSTKAALALGAVIVAAISLLYTYVAHVVYSGNRWILTSDSLTQITQVGLFRKQSSQLSLANLEDVTVDQNGLFQSMVGYGTLKVETAGEHSKFTFVFCPNPNKYAKEIIAAHEAYIAENPEEMHTTNRPLANTSSFNQSYAQPMPQQAPVGQQYQQSYDPTQQYAQPQYQQPQQQPPYQQPQATPYTEPPEAPNGPGQQS
ncbi:MAG: PH domain-containing protein [Candidatus Saccharibacteria bacterium]